MISFDVLEVNYDEDIQTQLVPVRDPGFLDKDKKNGVVSWRGVLLISCKEEDQSLSCRKSSI